MISMLIEFDVTKLERAGYNLEAVERLVDKRLQKDGRRHNISIRRDRREGLVYGDLYCVCQSQKARLVREILLPLAMA